MSEDNSNPTPDGEPAPPAPAPASVPPAAAPALGAFPPPSVARLPKTSSVGTPESPGEGEPVEPSEVDEPKAAASLAAVEVSRAVVPPLVLTSLPAAESSPPVPPPATGLQHAVVPPPAMLQEPPPAVLLGVASLPVIEPDAVKPAVAAGPSRRSRLVKRAQEFWRTLRQTAPARARDAPSSHESPGDVLPAADAPAAEVTPFPTTLDGARALTLPVVVVLMVTSLIMVLFHMQPSSRENANTGSRYATIESLVDFGTWNIDKSRYVFTPDKVKARGHFVSSKPPLLPTYGAGIYFLLKKITGYGISDNEGIVVWTVGVFTGWLSHLVFLVYFYRLSRLLLVRQLAILLVMAAACFAYLGVAYATAINNHSPAASLATVGFYYAFRARRGIGGRSAYLLAGFWLGILPAIDLTSAALTAFCAVYLATRHWKRTLLLYIPLTIPGLATQVLLAHDATGSWIPAYADSGLSHFAGSYFGGRTSGIDALFEPKPLYAFHVLLGHHGLFSMTPLFCFSVFELGLRLARRRDKYFAEAAVFLSTITIVSLFYIFRTHNYGGWCVGMRWLVPVMPWLLIAFGLFIERATLGRLKWSLVVFAFAVSVFNVQDGLTSPFQFSIWHNFVDGQPNRNRLGPKWNLGRPDKPDARRSRPSPKPKPRPATPPAPP